MRRNNTITAVVAGIILCLLLPAGFFYTVSRSSVVVIDEIVSEPIIPNSIFDGMEVHTDGRWYLLPDGRLVDLTDGRVYSTNLTFSAFERIEIDGNRFLADGKPFMVYRTKVYLNLGALNSEYETLKARFPDAIIAAVSNMHLAADIGGFLYIYTETGTISVFSIDWNLYGDEKSLFDQICLLYEQQYINDDRYYIFDGGGLRCFDTIFGEQGI